MNETISNQEGTFLIKPYYDYIASNLSEFGCAVFLQDEHPDFNFDQLLNYLQTEAAYLGKLDKVVLQVADTGDKKIHRYPVIVNCENRVAPFGFFDAVRTAANRFGWERFYACDFHADGVFEITANHIEPYGRLKDLARLLNINSSRHLCCRFLKWCAPHGWKYLHEPKVFRSDAERVYYEKYREHLQDFRILYTLDECQAWLEQSTNTYNFDKPTILEFEIDNPYLNIKADVLKARNLIVKTLKATEVYCGHLRCQEFTAPQIHAEGIECQKYTAAGVHTNIRYGLQINPNIARTSLNQNFASIIRQVKSLGGGFQDVLARFIDSHGKAVFEPQHLFINHLLHSHANNLKHEYDFTHISVVDQPLTIAEQIKFFGDQYPDYAKYDLELWQIQRPRPAYFHTTNDLRLIKIYDKQIRRENEN